MTSVINLKKRKRRWWREATVIALAVIVTTLGIKAADNFRGRNEKEQTAAGACPPGMVIVPMAGGNFCIDAYEASAGPGCPNGDPGNQGASLANLDDSGCQAVSVKDALPWRNLSRDQAAIACARAGKRLPTNAEWQQAALGTPDPIAGWGPDDCQVNANRSGQPGLTGQGKKCLSAAGAYDMIGNVWEWVEETVDDGILGSRELPPAGYIDGTDGQGLPADTNPEVANDNYYGDYFWIKNTGVRALARGGYWDNGADAGLYAAYAVLPPSAVGTGIGFRCVK